MDDDTSKGVSQNTIDGSSVSGTTARLTLPAEEFAFVAVFERAPDTRIELESTATCLDDHSLVKIITDEHDRDRLESALQTDPAVTDIGCVAERTDGWTYRLQWDGRARRLMERFVAEDTTLLSAQGRENRWHLHVLTPDRRTLSQLYETIRDHDYTVSCRSITAYEGGDSTHSELTDKQRETLAAAYEAGYYEIPQGVTADELADHLDISHQALSERLHRAYKQLVKDELIVDDEHPN
jgi:predicted DNA binding protein